MKNLIKNTIAVLVLAVIMSTSLYAQENKEMSKMMKDNQKKEQVYTAIMENPELKKEMMQRMMKDAKKDSTSCKMMGDMMMKEGHMQDMMMGKMVDGAAEDDGMCGGVRSGGWRVGARAACSSWSACSRSAETSCTEMASRAHSAATARSESCATSVVRRSEMRPCSISGRRSKAPGRGGATGRAGAPGGAGHPVGEAHPAGQGHPAEQDLAVLTGFWHPTARIRRRCGAPWGPGSWQF